MDTEDKVSLSNVDIAEVNGTNLWRILGQKVPKGEIVFFTQVIILYTVILTSIYNLSTGIKDTNLWTALLSCSLGYLLPSPTIKTPRGCF